MQVSVIEHAASEIRFIILFPIHVVMNSYGASTVLEITQKSLTLQCWPKINIFVDENFNVRYIGDYKLKSFGV